MNSHPINYNSRFGALRENPVGEGVETSKGAKATTIAEGDHHSSAYGDMMLYRHRTQNNGKQGFQSKNLAYNQLRN